MLDFRSFNDTSFFGEDFCRALVLGKVECFEVVENCSRFLWGEESFGVGRHDGLVRFALVGGFTLDGELLVGLADRAGEVSKVSGKGDFVVFTGFNHRVINGRFLEETIEVGASFGG